MSEIPDWASAILLEEKAAKLQDDYDRFFVNAWFSRPWGKVWQQLHFFMEQNNNQLPLHRVPSHDGHRSVTITRFFAAYLPKTSGVLFSSGDKDKAIKTMKTERLLTLECDRKKAQSDRNELKHASKHMHKALTERIGGCQFAEASNSNWRKCK